MARIIEKIVAGTDATKDAETLASAQMGSINAPSVEALEAREARAREQAEDNSITTNALIYPQPGETIGVRVREVSDEEAAKAEGGKTISVEEAIKSIGAPSIVSLAEGEGEADVDARGMARTSPQASSAIAGSGTLHRRDDVDF